MCCVIIYKPNGIIADKELLELRFKSNNDSWGYCYSDYSEIDLMEMALVTHLSNKSFDVLWESIKNLENKSVLLHLRTATSGKEKNIGKQPIVIKKGVLDVKHISFFLNGNLKDYFGKDEPDTVLYAREYLDKLPVNFLENKEIMAKITEDAKINGAKMAFMDSNGKVYLINEEAGIWEKGMWFSNPRLGSYAGFGFSGIYPYKNGEKRYNL